MIPFPILFHSRARQIRLDGPGASAGGFSNTYEDATRASAYDELRTLGTYRLVFDNLPDLFREEISGTRALDFGCGTGRSSRFLESRGFQVTGVDISREMVAKARERDPEGEYRVITDGDFSGLGSSKFDLILSAFTFDNVPGRDRKVRILKGLKDLLSPGGRLVNVVSTPEIYRNEWVTFSTRDFPENRDAQPGDVVRIVTLDYSDPRPVDDILWPDESYRAVYEETGLSVVRVERPLATGSEGVPWKSETRVAPWAIYILRQSR